MTGAEVKRTAVPRTLSLCLALGRTVRQAREAHTDPVDALRSAPAATVYTHLRVLFQGKVVDVERRTVGGARGRARFSGRARFKSFEGDSRLEITFQNEHLVVVLDGEVRCTAPDSICVLEEDTAESITDRGIALRPAGHRGRRLDADLVRTPEALAVFGPACCGLDVPFRRGEELVQEDIRTARVG